MKKSTYFVRMFDVYAETKLFENSPLGFYHLVLVVVVALVDWHRFDNPFKAKNDKF
jgi:hypothetical protein